MKQPLDISASKASRSMFISDPDDLCLWRVQMPGGGISRWEMDGTPGNLSITSSDELIVDVRREDRYYLDIFSCSDVTRTQSIPLPTEVKDVRHAVQSSNGNIIILHSTENFPDVYQISELSIDGRNFIRTFDPRSVQSMNIKNWSSSIIYRSMMTDVYSSLTSATTEFICWVLNWRILRFSWSRIQHQLRWTAADFVTYERSNSWSLVRQEW